MSVKKLTRADVEERVAQFLPGWTIRDDEWEPKNSKDIAPLLCPKGHSVDRTVNKIMLGNGCPNCNAEEIREKHAREFITALKENGYEPLFDVSDYVNSGQKLPTRCPHNSTYMVAKAKFDMGRRCNCPACRKQKGIYKQKRRTPEEAIRELWERGEEVIGEYVNTVTKVMSRCRACGYEREIIPIHYLTGSSSCSRCAGNRKYTTDEYRREVETTRPGWTLAPDAEYVNNKTPIPHICNNGHIAMMRPNSFRNGYGCDKCADIANAEQRRGKNSHLHDPTLTDEQRQALRQSRTSPETKRWSRAVKDRDGNECRACGATEGLVAHHLNAFESYVLLRHELANGITLCFSCHMELGHHDGCHGNETIFDFMDNILDKLNKTEDADINRRLSRLYDEMLDRLPVLLDAVNVANEDSNEESPAG